MYFVLGFLGALVAIAILLTGAVAGWKARSWACAKEQKVTAERLSEEDKRRIKDEQDAWHSLHNYSVADAYGMNRDNTTTSDKE